MKTILLLLFAITISVSSVFAQFEAEQIISTNAKEATSICSADIDGDGDMDVLSASLKDDKVAWYENTDGKGNFGSQQIIATSADGPDCVRAFDLDGDGDMDVLSSSYYDNKIAWYENRDGKGTFGPQQLISINANGASGVYGADFNGDNKVDVVSSSYYDNKIAWYVNNITKVQDDQNGDWTAQHVTLVNTPEAELMVRTGDIDNLGFGWPDKFNPFSGESTPAHSYPWTPDTTDAQGTDRIMVVSSYQYGSSMATDGYTYNTSRPENLPRPIVLKYNLNSINVQTAALQIFVDDFQASVWGAHYFVSINGVKIPAIAQVVNALVQTGPIGKLINVTIPPEYLYLVKQDSISILFDDNTTGAGDGYAIDFVKLLVNQKDYQYKAQIYGFITDSVTGKPVKNAAVSVPGIQSTVSDDNGHYLLNNLPAGINTVSVVTGCYDTTTILMDLSANDSTQHNFQLIKSNTIYSTMAGGYWKDTSTWTCGVVPVDTNDVVINGNVILDGYGHACNNLTINKGDTLYNISTSSNNLKIYGNIINHGAVIVKESYTLYPYGDIINNGIWDTYKISLEYGTVDEKIEINGHFTFYMFRINSNVDGAAHYQWYKNGQPISGATGSRYYLHNDEDYAGEYYCKTDAGNSRKITIVKENAGEGTILKEHFDGETFPPAGWTQKITNTAKTWMKGNPSNHPFTEIDSTNNYSAICPYVAEDQDEWLKTPAVALPSGTIKLEFYAGYNSGWLSKAIVKLHISTDGGASWTKLGEAENDGKAWEWRKVSVDLSDYAGQTIMLAWQYVGNDGDLMAIDNVEITQGTTGLSNHYANEEKLKLENYPNPFSQQTTISFILPERMNVKLEILNIFGQIIDVPVNKVLIAGHYKIVYKPTSGTYGIYFFRLKLNDKTVTRKMVYTK